MLKTILKLTCCVLWLFPGYINAEIYKWVDAQGNVHYGDKIHANSSEKNNPLDLDISTQGNLKLNDARAKKRQKLLSAYDDDRERENKQKEKEKKINKKKARACVRYKDKMRRYDRANSLYRLDKEGKRIVMSNEERDRSTLILKNKIKKYCK